MSFSYETALSLMKHGKTVKRHTTGEEIKIVEVPKESGGGLAFAVLYQGTETPVSYFTPDIEYQMASDWDIVVH